MAAPIAARPGPLTRREFIWRVARHGGATALGAMFALDLLARDDRGGRPQLEGRAPERRRRVIILGAGMAGLSTAYELGALGYECTVLEARQRPGGRCWTIRAGTEETEIGGERQVCRFDDGLFFNAGPMRIAHHHASTLAYCREFGIPLVAFPNINEAAFVHRDGFPRLRFREVRADWRGHTAELLAKSIQQGQLNGPLTNADRERVIEYLRAEGRLDAKLIYPRGREVSNAHFDPESPRGFTIDPGASDQPGTPPKPLELEAVLKAGYPSALSLGQIYDQQPTMLTPAGGMDRVAFGFAQKLGTAIRYAAQVREVRRSGEGVRIVFAAGAASGVSAEAREITGDFCVCTIPPHLLARLPADFSAATAAALRLAPPGAAGKIGLQFKRRFWEEDDAIFGGLSLSDQPIEHIGYPFDGFGTRGKGIVMGYYHFGAAKAQLDDLPFAERERRALAQGAKLHPQYSAEFENSFSIGWHRIPHSEMPWIDWWGDARLVEVQRVLGGADGPFYFAGDWLSNLNGWQAGAFVEANRVCRQLHARAGAG